MTAVDLVALLVQAGVPAYELAAPKGLVRYAVVAPYGAPALFGDDSVLMEWEKVQIDICCQHSLDTIAADVKAVLAAEDLVWETVTAGEYDPEYNLLRWILLVELI